MKKKWIDFLKFRSVQQELKYFNLLQAIYNTRPAFIPRYLYLFIGSVFFALFVVALLFKTSMPREAVLMAGIFTLSAVLWITEAIPLFATGLLVVGLEVFLLSNPGNWSGLGFESNSSPHYTEFLSPLSDPIMILFFSGFLLANATVKEGVDKVLASGVLKFFGDQPAKVLLGFMVVTSFFSMWLSNTATTAMMLALVIPIMNLFEKHDPFRKALLLAIPFSANIGGIGTPIASPPNAVAVGVLKKMGIAITFFDWILIALPVLLVTLMIGWMTLKKLFPPLHPQLSVKIEKPRLEKRGVFVIVVFLLTVLLWLTESLHSLPTAVVSILPIIAFTVTGLINREDVNTLEWHVLILIVGGIALGLGMQLTRLDSFIVRAIEVSFLGFVFLISAMALLLSTFMSNTAASNLLIPIGVSFSAAQLNGGSKVSVFFAILIAFSSSFAMALPVSTPPNTIAYSKGELGTKDFIIPGIIIGVVGWFLSIAIVWLMTIFLM